MKVEKQCRNLLIIIFTLIGISTTSLAATPEDVFNKSISSYTAGTNSVYGPRLTQEQLNQVAQVVAQFKTQYITDDMDERQKIRAASDFLKSVCEYAPDWSENGANTAWGALIYHQAQCSGYARAFKALCDAIDVGCYYVHADETASNPSHQWNIVRADGVWYHIDVQANDGMIIDVIYLTTEAPMEYDESAYPAIGVMDSSWSAQNSNEKIDRSLSDEEAVAFGFSTTTSPAAKTLEAGVYKVGLDGELMPGDYVIIALEDSVRYETSDGDGTENIDYNVIVHLTLETSIRITGKCSITPLEQMPNIDYRKGNMFKVGYHIPAGRYRLRSEEGKVGYYEICFSCLPQAQLRIWNNDFFEGAIDVTVQDGDFLKIGSCKMEKRIE